MLSRKYDKIIEIYSSESVPDGFGGSTVSNNLEYSVWSNVTTRRAYVRNEQGQNDNFVETVFTIRNRGDFSINVKENFIVYNQLTYNIDSVLNIDLEGIDIEIMATQRL